MSFLNNLVEKFTGNDNEERQYEQQGSYGSQQHGNQQYGNQGYGQQGPPQVPYPWVAEWDPNQNRYIFINRETGQRTHEYPQQSYGGGGGYEQRGQGGYGGGYSNEQPQQQSHAGRNAALAGAAGLAGGALLMHEGENIKQDWDTDKDRVENHFDRDENRVENDYDYDKDRVESDVYNAPDNAARWTGNKVQEVEDIPQVVEQKWDNGVQDVEDIPDDVAGWTGRKVGDVGRFGNDVDRYGDGVDNAYDQGRDERRYDDGDGY